MRVALVGTDTDCGKTTLACALLRAARAAGISALPFKPAASGPAGPDGDPERLVRAAGISGLTVDDVCPLRYPAPVAPGLAAPGGEDMSWSTWPEGHADSGMSDRACLLGHLETAAAPERPAGASASGVGRTSPESAGREGPVAQTGRELGRVVEALATLEARHRPALTVVEGAGGLWVPMPGGTWLPAWISALAAAPVVVGRLGLGTVNHCLLTISGLRRLGLAPLGFFLSETHGGDDPSRAHNERVIAEASGLPCLGVLRFAAAEDDHAWLRPRAWERLLAPGDGASRSGR